MFADARIGTLEQVEFILFSFFHQTERREKVYYEIQNWKIVIIKRQGFNMDTQTKCHKVTQVNFIIFAYFLVYNESTYFMLKFPFDLCVYLHSY